MNVAQHTVSFQVPACGKGHGWVKWPTVEDARSVKLKSHTNLVYSTINFTLQNETDEQFFDVCDLDVKLLSDAR